MSTADVERLDVRTRDCEVAVEVANGIAPHRARVKFDDPREVEFRIRTAMAGDFGSDLVRAAGVHYATDGEPLDFLLAGTMLEGSMDFASAGREVALTRGSGFLYPLRTRYTTEADAPAVITMRLSLGYTARLAESATGIAAAELRFESMTPLPGPMTSYWTDTSAYLCRQLNAPDTDLPPLILEQLRRLAATAVLSAFPNTTMTAARLPRPGQAGPGVVRRARTYIEANAEHPIEVADVATAAGVGARALQAAFRRYLDTTPMAYLRKVRLENVRRDLRDALPGSGVTVAATARRWGFGNLSRFAGDYRSTFDELPSDTLRR